MITLVCIKNVYLLNVDDELILFENNNKYITDYCYYLDYNQKRYFIIRNKLTICYATSEIIEEYFMNLDEFREQIIINLLK